MIKSHMYSFNNHPVETFVYKNNLYVSEVNLTECDKNLTNILSEHTIFYTLYRNNEISIYLDFSDVYLLLEKHKFVDLLNFFNFEVIYNHSFSSVMNKNKLVESLDKNLLTEYFSDKITYSLLTVELIKLSKENSIPIVRIKNQNSFSISFMEESYSLFFSKLQENPHYMFDYRKFSTNNIF